MAAKVVSRSTAGLGGASGGSTATKIGLGGVSGLGSGMAIVAASPVHRGSSTGFGAGRGTASVPAPSIHDHPLTGTITMSMIAGRIIIESIGADLDVRTLAAALTVEE